MFVLMLDWQGLPIELFPTEEDPNKRYIRVDETLIVASLVVKQTRPFNSKEAAIRNTFDVLFKWLERFDQYIESGLVKYSDFHPYLRY